MFISTRQFAAICNVKPSTVAMWIKNGRIESKDGLITVHNAYVFLNQHGLIKEANMLKILMPEF